MFVAKTTWLIEEKTISTFSPLGSCRSFPQELHRPSPSNLVLLLRANNNGVNVFTCKRNWFGVECCDLLLGRHLIYVVNS